MMQWKQVGNFAVLVMCSFLEKTNMTFEAIMLTSLNLSLLMARLPLCESSSTRLSWIPHSRTEGFSRSSVWAPHHSTPRYLQLLVLPCLLWPIFMSGTSKGLDRLLYRILKPTALCMCNRERFWWTSHQWEGWFNSQSKPQRWGFALPDLTSHETHPCIWSLNHTPEEILCIHNNILGW